MASTLISGIYPPFVDTYNPTFIYEEGTTTSFNIYFTISNINNIADLKEVHVVLSKVSDSSSLINDISHVLIYTFDAETNIDTSITTDYKYFITVKISDLKENSFSTGVPYKAQLRFSKTTKTESQGNNEYFNKEQNNFSEWSTLCIVRAVDIPVFVTNTFEENILNTQKEEFVSYIGTYNSGSDVLSTYTLTLYDGNEVAVDQSEEITASQYTDVNTIDYSFYDILEDGDEYFLSIDYQTKFGYVGNIVYNFIYSIDINEDLNNISISVTPDDINGLMLINITSKDIEDTSTEESDSLDYNRIIYIYRTDSNSDFTKYEVIYEIASMKGYDISTSFYDKTAESGIFYKYAVRQKRRNDDILSVEWSNLTVIDEPVMVFIESIYLVGDNKYLKISFDPDISTYGYTVKESVTDTIGGQYPVINRGGDKEYRTFQMTGTICSIDNVLEEKTISDSTSIDEKNIYTNLGENLFSTRSEVYTALTKTLYEDYNNLNSIEIWNDFNFERFFREAVLDFLYDGNVKLFKSAPEGNILVRLTKVQLTAKNTQVLGRMIYGFSATAIEVDEFNASNCDLYGIQTAAQIMETSYEINASTVQDKWLIDPKYDIISETGKTVDFFDDTVLDENYNITKSEDSSQVYILKMSENVSISPNTGDKIEVSAYTSGEIQNALNILYPDKDFLYTSDTSEDGIKLRTIILGIKMDSINYSTSASRTKDIEKILAHSDEVLAATSGDYYDFKNSYYTYYKDYGSYTSNNAIKLYQYDTLKYYYYINKNNEQIDIQANIEIVFPDEES